MTVWGLDARGLHDRFWAAHGVQVVRRGLGEPPSAAAGLYLLILPHQLTLFELPNAAGRLSSRCPQVVRIGATARWPTGYSEHVCADEAFRLIAVQRSYGSDQPSDLGCTITRNADLASLWHACEDPSSAQGALARAAELVPSPPSLPPGLHFDARDREQAMRCILAMMARWDNISAVCPDVSQAGPGVWIHDSAVVEENVRLTPPVWIGAGAVLRRGQVIVGPSIIQDQVSVEAITPPAPQALQVPYRPAAAAPLPRRLERLGRRLFNIAFSAAALLLTAPLFPLIMLAIWLEDGRPFLFAHTRQTIGGRDFTCYKFRTMCRNAEQRKASLQRENACDGPQFHIYNDPRLLRVGRLLRRYHLDELPQFFNVLMGQMNVVGPRPSPESENQFCPAWRETRLSVKPGMTGLWQVSRTRAPNADFQEWIRYDIDYVNRRSWRLDLWIIYRTLRSIILRGNQIRGTVFHRAHRAEESEPAQSAVTAVTEDEADPGVVSASDDRRPIAGIAGPRNDDAEPPAYRAAA